MKGSGQEVLEFIPDVSSQIGFLHLCLIQWPGARHHAVCFQSSRRFTPPLLHLHLYSTNKLFYFPLRLHVCRCVGGCVL